MNVLETIIQVWCLYTCLIAVFSDGILKTIESISSKEPVKCCTKILLLLSNVRYAEGSLERQLWHFPKIVQGFLSYAGKRTDQH